MLQDKFSNQLEYGSSIIKEIWQNATTFILFKYQITLYVYIQFRWALQLASIKGKDPWFRINQNAVFKSFYIKRKRQRLSVSIWNHLLRIIVNHSINEIHNCISSQVKKFNGIQTSVEPYFQRHGLSWIREKFESCVEEKQTTTLFST